MSNDANADRVVHDARLLMQTVRDEAAEGRRPYISDVRRLVEPMLALRYAEYVQFLEKYGFLTLDRRSNLLALTRAGEAAVEGDPARLRGLGGDARYHFGDRLPTAPVPASARRRGERLDARFLRLDPIGRGGLATVYAGRLLSVDRPVAIKLMEGFGELFRPDQQDEIRRRLELAVRDHARLVSPFIAQILEQNPLHDPPYFVMELAEGGDLRRLLANGALPPPVALRCFVQIALGLQVAHAEGVMHRDLKPENVLLDRRGNIKLVDFGITRVVEQDSSRIRQAYVGYGSVGYMAPEVFRPGHSLGPPSDLYALGIMLYEMLVGELPGRRSPLPSEVVAGVPQALDAIFDQMTQDAPERRFASVEALLEAVWADDDILALFDHREGPWFLEAPVPLPGLPGPAAEDALAPEPSPPPALEPPAAPPAGSARAEPGPRPGLIAARTSPAASAPAASAPSAPTPAPEAGPPPTAAKAPPAPSAPPASSAPPAAAAPPPQSAPALAPASAPPTAAAPERSELHEPTEDAWDAHPATDGPPAVAPEALEESPAPEHGAGAAALEAGDDGEAPDDSLHADPPSFAADSVEASPPAEASLELRAPAPSPAAVAEALPRPQPVFEPIIPAGPPPSGDSAPLPIPVAVPIDDRTGDIELEDDDLLDDAFLEVIEEQEGQDPRARTAVSRLEEGSAGQERRRALEEKLRRLKRP